MPLLLPKTTGIVYKEGLDGLLKELWITKIYDYIFTDFKPDRF